MDMICNEEKITRALLVSVDTGGFDAEASLAELEELVKSAGAEPAFTVTQKLQRPESATFVGSGKLEEIKQICEAQELDLIVVDSELSPTQINTRYLRAACALQGGQAAGRAGSAQISPAASDGKGRRDVPSRRRHRHQRSR